MRTLIIIFFYWIGINMILSAFRYAYCEIKLKAILIHTWEKDMFLSPLFIDVYQWIKNRIT